MISVTQALARALDLAPKTTTEVIALAQAGGRVLAAPAFAGHDQPPFAASAMDGYAVRNADVTPGTRLQVIGQAAAGHGFSGAVGPGQCARIFTGAPVPMGADRVVIQEDVTADGDHITLGDKLDTGPYIRPLGADFAKGQQIDAPRLLGPAQLALLAAMNVPVVCVAKRPVVAIISTGDELVEVGSVLAPGQIISSNAIALAEIARSEGAAARILPIARDNAASLKSAFALAGDADLIVTSGGASVGDHDLVAPIAQELGLKMDFYKVAMRPGKPLMAGRFEHTMLLGLPGNPVSSIVCAHIFLRPLLRHMQGLADVGLPTQDGVLGHAMPANGARTHFMRASFDARGHVHAAKRQDSALLGVLATAQALIMRPAHDDAVEAGKTVPIITL